MRNLRYLVSVIILIIGPNFIPSSYAATLWEQRGKVIQATKESKPVEEPSESEETILDKSEVKKDVSDLSIEPTDIVIPDQYGTIIETHEGTNGKLIVHVQDAHMNYEGQKNAAHILESLIEDYGLKLILLEGKVSSLNFNYIRARSPLDERIGKADELLKKGEINGVNYLNIATDYHIIIHGVEDKRIYDENRQALWEIDRFKDLASEYVNKLIVVSDVLKTKIYSENLLGLDKKKKDYDSENIGLMAYYEYLYKKAEEEGIPLYVFPNFQNLIKASDLEKKIDLEAIRNNTALDEEKKLYNEYTRLTRDLNINELFKEEPLLEGVLYDTFAANSNQKKLSRISKALSIMGNLLKIKVVPEEYKYFEDNKKDFDPAFWLEFLKAKSQELGISLDIPANYYVISDNLPKIEKFYGLAFERDSVFVKRAGEHINNENVKLAALVAGGFHTPTLTKLLKDEGYSYIVVSPRVRTETDDELYRSALKREWLPEIE